MIEFGRPGIDQGSLEPYRTCHIPIPKRDQGGDSIFSNAWYKIFKLMNKSRAMKIEFSLITLCAIEHLF
jgi:hypothetical protein